MQALEDYEQISTSELIKLCAVDNRLYEKTFFAKTVRQDSPEFHADIDAAFASNARYIAVKIFRGGAKTSKFRIFISKQIAYGIAHTILLVSNSQGHSVKSLEWLKRQVEFNTSWAQTYQLSKGARWSGEDIEILHGIDSYPIRVLALGITGQVRGVNIDDYRPDLIGVDDPDNEETTGSDEQIKKTSDLFFGALAKSLAPVSEAPHAKMVLMQTPLAAGDIISTCSTDPQWLTLDFGCFDANGRSRWEVRFPTEELLLDKAAHVKRGQLSLWMREMECTIIPSGGASFNPENIKMYDVLPENMIYLLAIDPASSEAKGADDQVIMVLGFWRRNVYVVEYTANRGEVPELAANTVVEYVTRYPILGIYVESISYQRVLATFLENEMRRTRKFVPVHRVQDRRRKSDRILQAVGRKSGYGLVYVRSTHSKLLTQYARYSPTSREHDDVLDALAMGIDAGDTLNIPDWIEGEYTVDSESSRKQLEFRSCP
jgi:hypothetical protein